jgi:hypothetical protein
VRHPMVQKVVDAYDKFETAEKKRKDDQYAEGKRIALEQSAQLQTTHAILTATPESNSEHNK